MSINHWCSLSIWFKKIKLKNKGPEFKIRNLPLFGRRSSSHHHFWPITRLILVTVWPSIDIGNMTFTVLPGSPALHALFLHPPPHPGTQTSEGLITYLPLELPWLSLCLLHRTVWKQTHISHYSFPCSSPFIILILTPNTGKALWRCFELHHLQGFWKICIHITIAKIIIGNIFICIDIVGGWTTLDFGHFETFFDTFKPKTKFV